MEAIGSSMRFLFPGDSSVYQIDKKKKKKTTSTMTIVCFQFLFICFSYRFLYFFFSMCSWAWPFNFSEFWLIYLLMGLIALASGLLGEGEGIRWNKVAVSVLASWFSWLPYTVNCLIKEFSTVMTRIDFQFPAEWLYHPQWLRQFSSYSRPAWGL